MNDITILCHSKGNIATRLSSVTYTLEIGEEKAFSPLSISVISKIKFPVHPNLFFKEQQINKLSEMQLQSSYSSIKKH
jgi:hypothetical protein